MPPPAAGQAPEAQEAEAAGPPQPPPLDAARKQQVRRLIAEKDYTGLRELMADWAPEVADLLLEIGKADRVLLFRALPRHLAAQVFAHLDPDHQDSLLRDLTDQEARHLLEALPPDDRTALLEELPAAVTRRLMGLLSPEDLREARQLLGYPEESVGRLMTPDYVAIEPEWRVSEALAHLRRVGKDRETVNNVYITNPEGQLLDDIPLRRLILADPETRVDTLRDHSFTALSAFGDREEAVRTMQRVDAFALPVVDSNGVILGIVTADDVFDVAEEEVTEDIHKGASVTPLGESYRTASTATLYRKRVGWLVALVLVSLVSSGIIAAFEEVLAGAIALAFFIPLLIGTGGNTGSQSAMLVVRALATGDVRLGQWAATFAKELAVGALLGTTLAVLTWLLGIFRGGPAVGLVVALTMMAIVVVANLVGAGLPFVLTRLGLDPAAASSPLITTMMDATGLLIYFTLAATFLGVG